VVAKWGWHAGFELVSQCLWADSISMGTKYLTHVGNFEIKDVTDKDKVPMDSFW
jgi:hypothetical protein